MYFFTKEIPLLCMIFQEMGSIVTCRLFGRYANKVHVEDCLLELGMLVYVDTFDDNWSLLWHWFKHWWGTNQGIKQAMSMVMPWESGWSIWFRCLYDKLWVIAIYIDYCVQWTFGWKIVCACPLSGENFILASSLVLATQSSSGSQWESDHA